MAIYETLKVCFGVAETAHIQPKVCCFPQTASNTSDFTNGKKNSQKLEKLTNILTAHHIIDRPAKKYVSAVSSLPFCFLNLDCEEN